jgi:hypothetical protein
MLSGSGISGSKNYNIPNSGEPGEANPPSTIDNK